MGDATTEDATTEDATTVDATPETDPRPIPGEPVSIDLLNTVRNSTGGPLDALDTVDGVRLWLSVTGLAEQSPPTEEVRQALRRTRAAIRAVAEAPAAPGPRAALNDVLARGVLTRRLTGSGPATTPRVDEETWRAAWLIAEDFLRLLEHPDRIRGCAHPHCVLYFYDTSPKANRRWCSMATCGNRAKAARHYDRSRNRPR